jgi:type I restriction enzyme, S subunit
MIQELQPYPAMKDSGVPWLGKMPEHWDLVPNRALLRKRKLLVGDRHTEYRLLSLTKAGVIVRDVSSARGKFSADMGTSQEVRRGDLVFCLFDVPETPRTVGLSHYDGMITGAYTIFECRDNLLARFVEAFYIAMDDRKLLSPLYSGLRNTIPPSAFLGVKTPLPPFAERAAIVRFLDHADRRIQRYIRAKQKLIKLLEEQKQAIIHRAVTRGLDPNVRLKPSGVEWLGDVPGHWDVVPLCALAKPRKQTQQAGLTLLSVFLGRGVIPFASVDEKRANPTSEDLSKYQAVETGDFILNNQQAWRGSVGVSRYRGIVSPAYFVLALDGRLQIHFADKLLAGRAMVAQYLTSSKGVGSIQRNLYWPHLRRVAVLVPPLAEQLAISQFLDQETSSLAIAIERASREIALLNEYRTRLIADVVTGKLDVREAAAQLPDAVDETEVLDEESVAPDLEATEDQFDEELEEVEV